MPLIKARSLYYESKNKKSNSNEICIDNMPGRIELTRRLVELFGDGTCSPSGLKKKALS